MDLTTIFITILFFLLEASVWPAHIILSSKSHTEEEKRIIGQIFDDVKNIVPEQMLRTFDRSKLAQIYIRVDYNVTHISSPHEMGYIDSVDTIHLSPLIFSSYSGSFPGSHFDFYHYSMAVLIHHLGHLYERALEKVSSPLSPALNPQFEKLAGFGRKHPVPFWTLGCTASRNSASVRSPDAQEKLNLSEFFSVNLEYYLLQPEEYPCRRPSINYFFNKHFKLPEKASSFSLCRNNSETQYLEELEELYLDPDRVYQIRYMQVGGGNRLWEKFGHSMFHFIICEPNRPLGPKCILDVGNHKVLGFAAEVSSENLSSWKGLTGQYPSRAFIYPLNQLIEYTEFQFRDVYDFPLRLSPEEKNLFVYQALEKYWEYLGRYKFINNNCVTEAQQLLQAALYSEQMKNFNPSTPTQLKQQLQYLGYIDKNISEDRDQAIQQGFVFPSRGPDLQRAFESLRNYFTLDGVAAPVFASWPTVSAYIDHSTPVQRKPVIAIIETRVSNIKDRIRTLLQFRLVEKHILAKLQTQIAFEAKNRVITSPNPTIAEFKSKWDQITEAGIPLNLPCRGYGIPLIKDFDFQQMEQRRQYKERYKSDLKKQVIDQIQNEFLPLITQTQNNIDHIDNVLEALYEN